MYMCMSIHIFGYLSCFTDQLVLTYINLVLTLSWLPFNVALWWSSRPSSTSGYK